MRSGHGQRSIINSLHGYKVRMLEQGQTCSNGVKNLESLPCAIKSDLFSGASTARLFSQEYLKLYAQLMQ